MNKKYPWVGMQNGCKLIAEIARLESENARLKTENERLNAALDQVWAVVDDALDPDSDDE
jgi:hypothetical protein